MYVEFHSDTTKRGIKAKTYLFWSKKVKLFFFFFFSLFPAHFLAVIVKGTFQRFYTVPRAISTKCRPICQKSLRRTLFLAGNCMISYVFEKLNWRQQQNNPLCFVGIFFSLIHVKLPRNVNENGRNYEEKSERENESAGDGPQRNKEKAGERNDGLCLKRGSKRACLSL